jgi:hypothetical protein
VLVAAIISWKYLPARATGGHHFSAAESMTAEAIGAHAAEEEAVADDLAARALHDGTPVAGD